MRDRLGRLWQRIRKKRVASGDDYEEFPIRDGMFVRIYPDGKRAVVSEYSLARGFAEGIYWDLSGDDSEGGQK